MPRTTTKAKPRKPKTPRPVAVPDGDVFTLTEAAAYLRLTEDQVKGLVRDDGLPGRVVGSEWRFLKASLQDWLRGPDPRIHNFWSTQAGALKDDSAFQDFCREEERKRNRSLAEAG